MSPRQLFCILLALSGMLIMEASTASRPTQATSFSSLSSLALAGSLQSPLWDTCYSTYNQIDSSLHATATQYPQIAAIVDGGLAWEGSRHIWAMKLGSHLHPHPYTHLNPNANPFRLAHHHPHSYYRPDRHS